jgi:hypothetical protein
VPPPRPCCWPVPHCRGAMPPSQGQESCWSQAGLGLVRDQGLGLAKPAVPLATAGSRSAACHYAQQLPPETQAAAAGAALLPCHAPPGPPAAWPAAALELHAFAPPAVAQAVRAAGALQQQQGGGGGSPQTVPCASQHDRHR